MKKHRWFGTAGFAVLVLIMSFNLAGSKISARVFDCPGALPSRLKVGMIAGVHTAGSGQTAIPVRVRSEASVRATVVGQLQTGDSFVIRDGPMCADGYLWWQIEAIPNLKGWVAESTTSDYLIDPALPVERPTAPPTVTPVAIDCPDTLPTKLNIGIQGVVRLATPVGATPNSVRVREQPTTKAKLLGSLDQGTSFTVIGGPQCADGYLWWQIKVEGGLTGWVAESTADKYNVVPATSIAPTNRIFVIVPVDCPEAVPTRLRWGVQARVVAGKTLTLYESPKFTARPVTHTRINEPFSGTLNSGTQFTVGSLTGQAQVWDCVDAVVWWVILLNGNQVEGWIPESRFGEYLVEPISPIVTATVVRYTAPYPTQTAAPIVTQTPRPTETITRTPTNTPIPSITFTPSVVPTSGPTLTPPAGKSSAVLDVAFAPDAVTFLAGYADGTARLWETETGRLLRQFEDKMDKVISVGFTPDGILALTASQNGFVYLWRVAGDQPPIVYDLHSNGTLNCAYFSLDGRLLVTCSSDGTVHLWTVGTPDPPKILKLKTSVLSAAFSRESHRPAILLGTADGTLSTWYYTHETVSRVAIFNFSRAVHIINSDNVDYIILGYENGSPLFLGHATLDISDNSPPPPTIETYPQDLATRGQKVSAIAGSGTTFALAFANTLSIQLYYSAPPGMGGLDPQAGMLVASATGHTGAISSMTFRETGHYLLTGSMDTTLRLWSIPDDLDVSKLQKLTEIRQYRLPYKATP